MSTPRRTPQQQRGERRLAELLEAAAAELSEVGYDAATMTAIAARAGASIGAVYQYFPNKEAIVRALREQYVEELEARLAPLKDEAAALSVEALTERMIEVMVDYIERRPAYLPLLNAPGAVRSPEHRNRLREYFAALFREKNPALGTEESLRVAHVTVQLLKGMNTLYRESVEAARGEIVAEFRLVLLGYLTARLTRG